jgi:hypothetical protein
MLWRTGYLIHYLILTTLGRITTPLLKLPITKLVIKVNKNDIDLCSYNLPERDEFVTKVIRVMIKFNKGVVILPIVAKLAFRLIRTFLLFICLFYEYVNRSYIQVRPKKRRKPYLRYLWLDLNKTKTGIIAY